MERLKNSRKNTTLENKAERINQEMGKIRQCVLTEIKKEKKLFKIETVPEEPGEDIKETELLNL